MYIPKNLELTDLNIIKDFITEHSFGVLVSSELTATHLPFIYESDGDNLGCLFGHFAKTNTHWQLADKQRVLVIFSGPHAYISPNWYSSTPAVPTWNYAAVHCYGVLTLLDDNENQVAMTNLITKYEPALLSQPSVMPAEYQLKLRSGVVGFKIVLDEIQAKEKLGQHRKPEDQAGVYAGLQQSNQADATALATYMAKRALGIGR